MCYRRFVTALIVATVFSTERLPAPTTTSYDVPAPFPGEPTAVISVERNIYSVGHFGPNMRPKEFVLDLFLKAGNKILAVFESNHYSGRVLKIGELSSSGEYRGHLFYSKLVRVLLHEWVKNGGTQIESFLIKKNRKEFFETLAALRKTHLGQKMTPKELYGFAYLGTPDGRAMLQFLDLPDLEVVEPNGEGLAGFCGLKFKVTDTVRSMVTNGPGEVLNATPPRECKTVYVRMPPEALPKCDLRTARNLVPKKTPGVMTGLNILTFAVQATLMTDKIMHNLQGEQSTVEQLVDHAKSGLFGRTGQWAAAGHMWYETASEVMKLVPVPNNIAMDPLGFIDSITTNPLDRGKKIFRDLGEIFGLITGSRPRE